MLPCVSTPFPTSDIGEARDVSNGCGPFCGGIADAHPMYEDPPPSALRYCGGPCNMDLGSPMPGEQTLRSAECKWCVPIAAGRAWADMLSVFAMHLAVKDTTWSCPDVSEGRSYTD